MNNSEENDELWQLLGKARKPDASPFFSRDVLREMRTSRQEKPGVFSWLNSRLRTVALGAAAAVLLAAGAVHFIPKATPRTPVEIAQQLPIKNDYEVITNLDELLAYEQSSIWLDDSSQ
jgi:hypothetical protein